MGRVSLCFLLALGGCYSAFGTDEVSDGMSDDVGDRPIVDAGPRDAVVPFPDGSPADLGPVPPDAFPPDLALVDFGPLPDGSGPDGGPPPTDMGPPPDLGPPVDLGPIPRPDLGTSDAAVGLDAGPPPSPTGCEHRTPPALSASGLRQEAYWFTASNPNANSTPVVADLVPGDGDPRPWIVWTQSNIAETEGNLAVARAGDAVAQPVGPPTVDPTATPAVADLDGDGDLEIVTLLAGSGTIALQHTGVELWRSTAPTAADRMAGGRTTRGAAVTLADLEGDGSVEVIVGKHILEGRTGVARGGSPLGDRGIHIGRGPISCVGDVNRDGLQEVIAGGTAYGPTGFIRWDSPSVPEGFCAIGQVTSSPGLEVVVVGQGQLFVLDGSSGALLHNRFLVGSSPEGAGGGPPALADVDGDGFMEIAVAHGDEVGVYDFTCGAACRNALRWRADMVEPGPTAGVSFGDLNGDGQWELFTNDRFALSIRRGLDGGLVTTRTTASVNLTQTPIVADVDRDGDAELVVPSSRLAARDIYVDAPRPGIQILGKRDGSWTGARSIWNQHAYHVTNVTDGGDPVNGAITDFRTQSPGDDPLHLPNLVGSATVECIGGGQALIRVSVYNAGLGPAGDFDVELTRGVRDIPVTTVQVAGPLNPGENADVAVVETWRPPMQLYVDRRRNGNVFECDESDNRIDLPDLICP